MTFRELFRLSHREFTAYKTRSRTTIVTIGILFGALLAALLMVQGLEIVTLKYAKDATGGEIYLASDYNDASLILSRIQKFGGVVATLNDTQKAEIGEEMPESVVVAKFANLKNAYEYYSKLDAKDLHYNSDDYQIAELFSNQIGVYRYFRDKNKDFVYPISIVLVAVSAFILAFTMAHLIASSTKSFVLYRSIGASKGQLLLIYFVYLLELCVWAVVFAIVLALALAGITTAVCWKQLSMQLAVIYPSAPNYWPVLVGVNPQCFAVILCMFLAAPVLVSTFLGEQLLGKSFPTEYADAAQKQKDYEEYRDKLIGKTFTDAYGAKYYVVGLNSGNFHVRNLSFRQLERGNSNILNPILELIATPDGTPIAIDNGRAEHWQSGEEALPNGMVEAGSESLIAAFDDSKSAYDYFQHGKGRFMNVDLPNRTYSVNIVTGISPEVMYVIKSLQLIANIVSIILILIAAIVVVFTSIRLVDQDQQNIALYYSLGATTRQVRMIYWCYFLELMIGAAILAFGLASAVTIMFSCLNRELIDIQSTLGFNLATASNEVWCAVNGDTFIIIVTMLIMSFMCIVVNHKRLANVSFENI